MMASNYHQPASTDLFPAVNQFRTTPITPREALGLLAPDLDFVRHSTVLTILQLAQILFLGVSWFPLGPSRLQHSAAGRLLCLSMEDFGALTGYRGRGSNSPTVCAYCARRRIIGVNLFLV